MKKGKFKWTFLVLLVITLVWWGYHAFEKQLNATVVIGIQPLGDIDQTEVDSLKVGIERYYHKEVTVLPVVDLPDFAFTTIRKPRYRADSLLKWLRNNRPDSVDVIVGLTSKDISITKYTDRSRTTIKSPEWKYRDFGIFGLGSVGGNECIVSAHRLGKEHNKKRFYTRLVRIGCHEVGHVLGLKHCPTLNCLMNDANESISTIDKSTGKLCAACQQKID